MSTAKPPETAVQVPEADTVPDSGGTVDLGRICWLITVGLLAVGVLVLALKRDWGYAVVTFAVTVSAAINLL